MLGCKAGKRSAMPPPIAGIGTHLLAATPSKPAAAASVLLTATSSAWSCARMSRWDQHDRSAAPGWIGHSDRNSMRSQGKARQRSMHVRATHVQHPREPFKHAKTAVRRPPRHLRGLAAAIASHQAETSLQSPSPASSRPTTRSQPRSPVRVTQRGRSPANFPGAALRAGWRRRIRCAGALAVAAVARPRPRTARWRQDSKWGRARSRRRRRHR